MKKVLIVEDDAGVREVLAEFFSMLGFEVSLAGSSKEALNLIEKELFYLYLLDIKLPQVDGLELAHHIRNKSNNPIIFLTGLINNHTESQARKVNNSYYLRKPVTFEMLKEVLNKAGVI
ncbi:response regulator receiver protein [Thermodesulfatator indicus DSM 15286]|uniref:Response regulator receiver protein n=1 Tax=Thermodesulfatator indicus (strain DSM 15286 / JCM 11887 / CIR29812) TaxID=667014 RepID=F8AB73_THEID|nr:response regulator [Thermodesulfatator indicus]AEH45529.1 response regulator receiver protein [Thermodesulfatator indicus DSM 15286]